MIQNIILLLVVNTLAPYTFVPPALLAPLPLLQVFIEPPSALQSMNLSRIHTSSQFRQAFRESLKIHHPDHGGSQEVFQQIQGLKKIMSKETNYYDLYNLTDADISSTSMKIEETVAIKKYTYFVETGIFYFICCLYILAFTMDNTSNAPRWITLAMTLSFLAYEIYVHQHPNNPTVIDYFYSKLPLFTQLKFMKRALSIWIALVRAYYARKRSEEDQLLGQLKQERPEQEYKDILERLKEINKKKVQQKQLYEKSWTYKLRNWVSKAVSVLFLLILIKNLIPGLNLL